MIGLETSCVRCLPFSFLHQFAGLGFLMTQPHKFSDRYRAGQHVVVWQELIALGAAVRQEPLLSEATTVCKEIVRRAEINLHILHRRLLDLGYEFAEPEAALKVAAEDAARRVEEFEGEFGTIPIVARIWYTTLESVNFCQADRQRAYLKGGFPPSGPDIYGLGSHPVLYFQSLERSREQLKTLKAEHEHYAKEARELGHEYHPTEFGFHLFLGGWASNCDPKGFALPCNGVDGVIFNDGGGDAYFVDELRKAFQWGGFPFWAWSLDKPKFYSPMEYRPNFEKLLPQLKEGLLEL
jgi:hypothetical protein